MPEPELVHWEAGQSCCDAEWEAAYLRFESPEEETRKFLRRLARLGAAAWPRESRVVELFCGRGSGLKALEALGFRELSGVDLSPGLLRRYRGPARLYVGDCRRLKFAERSFDLAVVQGGLHHLPRLPEDLERTLAEIHRVLTGEGRLALAEPWPTPYLRLAVWAGRQRALRRLWPKLDAFAAMTERERTTYENWLARPDEIRGLLGKFFACERWFTAAGTLHYLGRRREGV
jgi:SAM-dependent methyltransferase